MVSKNVNKISVKEFNKLTNKQSERIIKNRNSARRSYIKRKIKIKNLIIENQQIKETLDLIKSYIDNLNLIINMNELSRLNEINVELPKLYDEDINIIPSLYD